ncbi:hypothetical protein [Salinivibrio costicola]|nr:hypothetical protein [Salinivibrio costicola]
MSTMMHYANGRLSRSVPILTTMSDGARPAWVFIIDIVLALMPTYA